MSDALTMLAYAIGAGTAGAALLRNASWPQRAPRLGVATWQALSWSVLAALLLAGVSLVIPTAVVGTSLADLLTACAAGLRAQYATPGGAAVGTVGLLGTSLLAYRTGHLIILGHIRARRAAADHLFSLRLAARLDGRLDAFVIEHPTPAAYCLPGAPGTIVLTSAAIHTLAHDELAAVLAHERAHLAGRHHLVMARTHALARAVPFLPIFRWARTEQARLLEMIADDAAVHQGTRQAVARALLHLAEQPVPPLALGAADIAAVVRVQRLLGPTPRLGTVRRLLIVSAIVGTALAPAVIVTFPALNLAGARYCPVSTASRRI